VAIAIVTLLRHIQKGLRLSLTCLRQFDLCERLSSLSDQSETLRVEPG